MVHWLSKTAVVLGLFAPVLALPQEGTPDPELSTRGRDSYLGRRIARTMHWTGASWLLRATREKEENSSLLLDNLGIEEGQTICDLGCGNGYFTLPMAERVGPEGKLYGVDIQQEMLTLLEGRVRTAGLKNVESVLGTVSDPKLPPSSCDKILMVDVYHEISHPVTVLSHLRRALKPEGRLLLVEFRLEDPKVPIKLLHKMSKAQMITEMSAGGLIFAEEFDDLPWQHVMAFSLDPEFPREIDGVQGQQRAEGEAIAAGIVRAWKKADAPTLSGFLGDEIFVRAGSEILKKGNGGGTEDASAGLVIDREEWLERYTKRFATIERAKWTSASASWTSSVEEQSETPWEDARASDIPLSIRGDQHLLELYLRRNSAGQWLVVSERSVF